MNKLPSKVLIIGGLCLLLLFSIILALGIRFPYGETVILTQVRLPRLILGMVVGMGLAVSGAAYQALFRNPLADPSLLGTSSGAALGMVLAYSLNKAGSLSLIYSSAFGTALFLTLLAYFLARQRGQTTVFSLLLSGLVVSAFASALIMLVFSLESRDMYRMMFFLFGYLGGAKLSVVLPLALFIILNSGILLFVAPYLDIFALGEEKAASLGIAPERIKLLVFLITSLLVSSCVVAAGVVTFVGLIVPHSLRLISGPANRSLLPFSALGGAFFLLLMDVFARNLAYPRELPVGVFTALGGAPFFLFLLRRQMGRRD